MIQLAEGQQAVYNGVRELQSATILGPRGAGKTTLLVKDCIETLRSIDGNAVGLLIATDFFDCSHDYFLREVDSGEVRPYEGGFNFYHGDNYENDALGDFKKVYISTASFGVVPKLFQRFMGMLVDWIGIDSFDEFPSNQRLIIDCLVQRLSIGRPNLRVLRIEQHGAPLTFIPN